jgi:hypothetical protein
MSNAMARYVVSAEFAGWHRGPSVVNDSTAHLSQKKGPRIEISAAGPKPRAAF